MRSVEQIESVLFTKMTTTLAWGASLGSSAALQRNVLQALFSPGQCGPSSHAASPRPLPEGGFFSLWFANLHTWRRLAPCGGRPGPGDESPRCSCQAGCFTRGPHPVSRIGTPLETVSTPFPVHSRASKRKEMVMVFLVAFFPSATENRSGTFFLSLKPNAKHVPLVEDSPPRQPP